MINYLTGKSQKRIAIILFLLFYAELAGTLYAGKVSYSFLKRNKVLAYTPEPETEIYNKTFLKNEERQKGFSYSGSIYSDSAKIINMDSEVLPQNDRDLFIGGPAQPEMSSFRSVGADNMVNLFTGDFSYNIPLLDVGGYPVNLFYSAGASMDQEATWVGLGWNLNPGTISRNMRGLPDDYDGVADSVKKVQSMKPDVTVGVSGAWGKEVIGLASTSASGGVFYNNRRGIGVEAGVAGDMSIHTMITRKNQDDKTRMDTIGGLTTTLSAGVKVNSQNGMTLNGGFHITKSNIHNQVLFGMGTGVSYQSRQGLTDINIAGESRWYAKMKSRLTEGLYSNPTHPTVSIGFARSSFTPSIRMPVTTRNQLYQVKLGKSKKILFNNSVISGYVNESRVANDDTVQSRPAYGYIYYEQAGNKKDALLDFNRTNDGVYTYKTPVISLPAYTYDVFSINGEGTGGSFRGYRGNMGFMRDPYTHNKSGSFSFTLDLGPGGIFHGGTAVGGVFSPSYVEDWTNGNVLRKNVAFEESKGIYQGVYFKNPGERAIIDEAFYDGVGGDRLIRPYLNATGTISPILAGGFQAFNEEKKVDEIIPISGQTRRNVRDKRSQVISMLTAEEADMVGLDKYIYSVQENLFLPGSCSNPLYRSSIKRYNPLDPTFYRKGHHISQINVLEASGQRYVYGIPVYQVLQKEVTFSTESTPTGELIGYDPNAAKADNSTRNTKGRDGFYQREEINGYAHSFLLTGILSPDYVDVTGDGITDDDLGTAVKFNYSRVDKRFSFAGKQFWYPFRWRMPIDENKARYNEGLKADAKDDKGMYTYGEKELWYLHSIESKNMVANFYTSARQDGTQVKGENGGLSTSDHRQRKLDSIHLYSKAEYLKHGIAAKPIKSVYLKYSYKLCPDYILNSGGSVERGKLTLDSLWFTFNGNNRQKKNRYVFRYAGQISVGESETINANPAYNAEESDRWGNYKPHNQNPKSGTSNANFPYTLQDKIKSDAYAAAWNLTDILLPGGGSLHVQYEADDYAYVQDKRASQMTHITGFGMTKSSTPVYQIYEYNPVLYPEQKENVSKADYRFVFFDSEEYLADKRDVAEKYLQDFKQLLLKLWVKMPSGGVGVPAAFEQMVVYGTIKDYGLVPSGESGFNHYKFYIELEETRTEGSPIMETAMQFLKDHLPQRAYPGSDATGNGALIQVVNALYGVAKSLFQGVLGFERDLKASGGCRLVDGEMAFARLNNPSLKKIGGGYRVKKIVINDNWEKMTKRGELTGMANSYYGQEYDYTTTQEIRGEMKVISSGVASYEPSVGNEENPFKEVIKYNERQFLGPTDANNIELPVGEMFFPSPVVGYSKVTVRSIHNKTNKRIKSGIGMEQVEFYTNKEFPIVSDYTYFDKDSRHQHKPPPLNQVFKFDQKNYLTLTQGFRVVLNDMNGKMKSTSSFAENDLVNPINYTFYHYRLKEEANGKFSLDNTVPVINGPDGLVSHKLIGKDVEVMNDFRQHTSLTYTRRIPINADFFTAGGLPMLLPSVFRMLFRDETRYRSATTMKIVNEYGILDSVVNLDKGSVVGTKNMVYDAETGDVILSRTTNEFRKPVYNFTYPAWWANAGMEPAYKNIDLVYDNVLFRNGRIEESSHVNMSYFESGDEIMVLSTAGTAPEESSACISGGYPDALTPSGERLIWAVDLRKDERNVEPGFIFLDRKGVPFTAEGARIRIIRSGKRNLATASIGTITSLENPVQLVEGIERLVIDATTKVLSAGAVEYKEKWKVNDQFYLFSGFVDEVKKAPLRTLNARPVNTASVLKWRWRQGNWNQEYYLKYDEDHLLAKNMDRKREEIKAKAFVLFDLSSITATKTIISAKLSLYSHKKIDYTPPGRKAHFMDPYWANGQSSHTDKNPHYGDNAFVLKRMLTSWPGNNKPAFTVLLEKDIYADNSTAVIKNVTDPQFYSPINDLSYCDNCGTGSQSNQIDLLGMVRAMIRDRDDPAKGYATGLQLEMLKKNLVNGNRVCFNSGMYSIHGETEGAPTLTIKYYDCQEAYGLPGNPTEPPPGQELVDCVTRSFVNGCLSVFDKKQMNPYIQGVLGNWRPLRSYVFYGERMQSSPTVSTAIATDGVIKDFAAFWNLQAGGVTKTTNAKWVWNSEITQYNRKGAELENHDPLDRYNAGIYGYQESLPIAVINNSRLRLSAFDGFEDYFYKDDPCEPYCKPFKRHFNPAIQTSMLDTQAHTGKYSLLVASASNHQFQIPIGADETVYTPDIRIKLDKIPVENHTQVTPKGIGLTAYYYNDPDFGGSPVYEEVDENVNLLFFGSKKPDQNACPPPSPFTNPNSQGNLPDGIRCNNMSVIWKGKLQVITTGQYEFQVDMDDYAWVNIKAPGQPWAQAFYGWVHGSKTITPITLSAGVLYEFEVKYKQYTSEGRAHLLWRTPNPDGTASTGKFTPIDKKHFYPIGQDALAENTSVTTTVYCEKVDTVQAIKYALIDSFSLVPGKKMVASVWVKRSDLLCNANGYVLSLSVKNSSGTTIAGFQPREGIIEGWQLFEAQFTVPETGNYITMHWATPAEAAVNFDDFRMHPFNANMKSFVYHPETLRLVAELDENNFSTFYEYDDEGGLIRVKKESRQGIKTIKETRSAIQKTITGF